MSLTNGAGQFRFWYVATAVVLGVKSTSGKDFIMAVGSWPEAFAAKQVTVTGGTQYDRLGGRGPAVLLLHGFDDTGDMWVPLAEALVKIDTQTTAPASDRDSRRPRSCMSPKSTVRRKNPTMSPPTADLASP